MNSEPGDSLLEGDQVYDEIHDTTLVVSERDGQRVRLEGRGVVTTTLEHFERQVERGRFVVLERRETDE